MYTTTTTTTTVQFRIPDLFVDFPWPRIRSEFYHECKAESSAWSKSYHHYDQKGFKRIERCDFDLLAALVYSPREKALIRLGSDLMNLTYVFDESTDIGDGKDVEKIQKVFMDAFRNPHKERPAGEHPIGAMARDFWIRASGYVAPDAHCLKHFVQDLDNWTTAVIGEADDRSKNLYRTFEDYMTRRRYISGCLPCFALCEFGIDLPEEVYQHPRMTTLREQADDLVSITNDLVSYAVENASGLDIHNAVKLVMVERNLDLQGAVDWIEQYAVKIRESFLDNVANMPSWGEDVDQKVQKYINGLAQWVRGVDDWSFEGGRYFGNRGPEIRKTRIVTLRIAPVSNAGKAKKSA